MILIIPFNLYYSKSFRLGFLDASLDKNPNVKRDTNRVTVVYTTIFNVNISLSSEYCLQI